MGLNLFPVRVPIGKATTPDGRQLDVLMTPEFSRALAGILERVGGPDGMGINDIESVLLDNATTSAFDYPVTAPIASVQTIESDVGAQIAAMRRDLADFYSELAMLSPVPMQIDDLRVQIGMTEDAGALVRYLQSYKLPADIPVTFLNGWTNFGGALQVGAYYKNRDGVVTLRGLVKSGTINTPIFNLPAGYRPSALLNFPVLSNGVAGGVNVDTNGDVTCFIGDNAYVTLDGISFRTT